MHAPDRPALFLDRDGTVICDVGYPRDPDAVRLVPGAAEALAALQELRLGIVLISNQSGIGRGMIAPGEASKVHERVVSLLADEGVRLDGAYYCPHAPEAGCLCRKPSPGLLVQAAGELSIDLARSFMAGDKESDVQAGRGAGCRTILLAASGQAPPCEPSPDLVAADWSEAVAWIRDHL